MRETDQIVKMKVLEITDGSSIKHPDLDRRVMEAELVICNGKVLKNRNGEIFQTEQSLLGELSSKIGKITRVSKLPVVTMKQKQKLVDKLKECFGVV